MSGGEAVNQLGPDVWWNNSMVYDAHPGKFMKGTGFRWFCVFGFRVRKGQPTKMERHHPMIWVVLVGGRVPAQFFFSFFKLLVINVALFEMKLVSLCKEMFQLSYRLCGNISALVILLFYLFSGSWFGANGKKNMEFFNLAGVFFKFQPRPILVLLFNLLSRRGITCQFIGGIRDMCFSWPGKGFAL